MLRRATDLNDAYRVLKSDVRRAEYLLLSLHGIDLSESAEQGGGKSERWILFPLRSAGAAGRAAGCAEQERCPRIARIGDDIGRRMADETRELETRLARWIRPAAATRHSWNHWPRSCCGSATTSVLDEITAQEEASA